MIKAWCLLNEKNCGFPNDTCREEKITEPEECPHRQLPDAEKLMIELEAADKEIAAVREAVARYDFDAPGANTFCSTQGMRDTIKKIQGIVKEDK